MLAGYHLRSVSYTHLDVYKRQGNELVSRVRMADELNRIYCDKLNYTIVTPSNEFYVNRPAITQMESLYLYNLGILEESSFTKKIQKEMENVIL